MDNVLIDDRRIHVDFSQSVAKVQLQKQGNSIIHMYPYLIQSLLINRMLFKLKEKTDYFSHFTTELTIHHLYEINNHFS